MDAQHPTILLVEDDPGICTLLRDALEAEGHGVVCAGGHVEALVALAACRFGLVLADTAPGSVPGEPRLWAGLERLREAAGATPVAIFSAHSPAAFDDYAERGFVAVIAKPFDLDDLLDTVGRLLAVPATDPAPISLA